MPHVPRNNSFFASDNLTTDAGTVVQTLYGPAVDGGEASPYQRYGFDLTNLTAGESYILRFAEVDNNATINVGVDNVFVQANVPEPGTFALMGLGMGLAALAGRTRRG